MWVELQLSALATLMSPRPLPVVLPSEPLPPVSVGAPVALVVSVTSLLASAEVSAVAAVVSIVRSVGSISQVPVLPCAAVVSMAKPLKSTVSPDVSMRPPLPLAPSARAERLAVPVTLWPSTLMLPASPLALSTLMLPPRSMLPLVPLTLCALIPAGRLTTLRTASRAAAPLISAALPSVESNAPAGSATWRKPSPSRSRVAVVPAPITTLPAGTTMRPLLLTWPASSPTKPPVSVEMVPALAMLPPLPVKLPPVKLPLPARKSASAMSSVDATKPWPTVIAPPEVIWMPLGLMRKTLPLARISPAIVEVVPPVTRFSVALLASGWAKTTVLPAPTSKLCQLITALAEPCVTVSVVPLVAMLALPAATLPPIGSGLATAAVAVSSAMALAEWLRFWRK